MSEEFESLMNLAPLSRSESLDRRSSKNNSVSPSRQSIGGLSVASQSTELCESLKKPCGSPLRSLCESRTSQAPPLGLKKRETPFSALVTSSPSSWDPRDTSLSEADTSNLERSFSKQLTNLRLHWKGTKINFPSVFQRVEQVDGCPEVVQDFSGKVLYPNQVFLCGGRV